MRASLIITMLMSLPSSVLTFGIIGGVAAGIYPFFVLVEKAGQYCGGTIITADAVVTTAHCLFLRSKRRWAHEDEIFAVDADFWTPKWDQNLIRYACDYYRPHRLFEPFKNNGAGAYDIAVVKLKESFDLSGSHKAALEPCPYAAYYQSKYKYATAIGLGLTNQHPPEYPEILMEAILERDRYCGKYQRESGKIITGVHVCYSIPGEAAICRGDSGGPLVYKNKGEAVCLLGIASFGKKRCDDFDYPNVFTFVAYFGNWLRKQTKMSHLS